MAGMDSLVKSLSDALSIGISSGTKKGIEIAEKERDAALQRNLNSSAKAFEALKNERSLLEDTLNKLEAMDESPERDLAISDTRRGLLKNNADQAKTLQERVKEELRIRDEYEKAEKDLKKQDEDKKHAKMQTLAQGTMIAAETGKTLLKGSFEFIQQIYEKMKQASPLLQAVEQLFSLAMTLFFMPLGNKLGEMLIPAVIQLMDDVMAIWDSFEGKSLDEMFEFGVSALMKSLSTFFKDIGGQLEDQGGAVGNIGHMLVTIGNFLERSGAKLIDALTGLASFVMDHFKELIALIVTFKATSTALQIAQIYTTATSNSLAGWFGAGLATATALAGPVTYSLMSGAGLATGGHVDPVPGGTITRLAEAGEGEWVIPDSKMGALGGNTYNITFNGYNGDDVERIVQSCVNDSLGRSGFKGGFRWHRTRRWNYGEQEMEQQSKQATAASPSPTRIMAV